jgi:hypothetical protein
MRTICCPKERPPVNIIVISRPSIEVFGVSTHCDGFGVSYTTIFRIHGTSDMNVATQRLGTDLAFPTQRFSEYTVLQI